ncbi:glycosyl hydrolase family 28-related protein [Lactiplantibacillus pentosus]
MISTITLDTYKQQIGSGDAFNLSDSFNGRVGDEQVPLVVQFKERGLAHRFEDGLVPFLTGFVGSLDENNQVTAETGEAVSYVGTSDDIVGLGRVKMNLPGTMFPQEGYFYGFLGLQNADGKRVTTFDVWFHVYNGNPDMFVNKVPFRTELQKLLDAVKLLIDDADGDLNKWKQKLTDLFTTLSAQGADTATLLTTLQAQIKQSNLFTQDQMDKLVGTLSDFKMAGTTVADKVNGEFEDRGVNVKWFGAVGDGVTDDTAALQDVFNKYDKIFMPAGNYVITKTLIIKKSNLTIYGQGVTILLDADDTVAVNMQGANIKLYDLNFRLVEGRFSGKQFCLGIADASSNVTLDNINISGFTNCVIDTYNSKNLVFNNCEFSNAMTTATAENPEITNGYGIVLQCSKHVQIINCDFNHIYRHCVYISCSAEHNTDYCDDITIDDCHINRDIDGFVTNFEHPIKCMSGRNVIVTNNYFKNCGSGLMVALFEKAADASLMQPENVIFRNNVFENLLAGQINHNGMVEELNGCATDGLFITDNIMHNAKLNAFIKLSKTNNFVINNNRLFDSTAIDFLDVEMHFAKGFVTDNTLINTEPDQFIKFLNYADDNGTDYDLFDEFVITGNRGYLRRSILYLNIINKYKSLHIANNDFYSDAGDATAIMINSPTDMATYINGNVIKGFRYGFGFPLASEMTRIVEHSNTIANCKMGTIEAMGANVFMIKPFRNPYKNWQNYVYSRSDNTMPDPVKLNYGDIYLPSTSNADGIASIVVDKNGSKAFAKISAIL